MSISVMAWVWQNGPEDQAELLVLLALADFANDAGECWPSMASIARKARLTERGAQKIIRRLEVDGRVSVNTGGGRRGCNTYRINLRHSEHETPNAVRGERGSGRTAEQKPRTGVHKTPNGGSPEPSGTIMDPSVQSRAREAAALEGESLKSGSDQGAVPARPGAVPAETNRERLLAAMGIGPSGVTGPASFIGTMADMAEAKAWSAMGMSITAQCEVIAEVCRRQRSRIPDWKPARFAYFTGAMRDAAAALTGRAGATPPPARSAAATERERKMAEWDRIAARHAAINAARGKPKPEGDA